MKKVEAFVCTDAISMDRKNTVLPCHCNCETGICNDCCYYTTWHGDPWCDRYNNEIRDSSREKDCYVR